MLQLLKQWNLNYILHMIKSTDLIHKENNDHILLYITAMHSLGYEVGSKYNRMRSYFLSRDINKRHIIYESALQTVLVDWKSAINNRKVVRIVFLDFQRAFETINRELLLLKMEKMGIGGYVLKWFQEYLCDRVQCTKYNNSVSSEKNTQFGVPQGTVLGPKLFIMYINDIVLHVKRCQIQLFADDTLFFSVGENVKSVIENLNYVNLKNLYRWLTDNNLKLNIN